ETLGHQLTCSLYSAIGALADPSPATVTVPTPSIGMLSWPLIGPVISRTVWPAQLRSRCGAPLPENENPPVAAPTPVTSRARSSGPTPGRTSRNPAAAARRVWMILAFAIRWDTVANT